MIEPTSPTTPAARVLVMSRRRSAGALATCAVMIAVGVVWIAYGYWPGWLVAGLFGAFGLVYAAWLVRPPTLRLDADGFVLTGRIGRSRRREWSDCNCFIVWGRGFRKQPILVVYSSGRTDVPLLRFVNIWLSGGDESILAGFGRLNAKQLAELLNECREAAVGPDEELAALAEEQVAWQPKQRSRLAKVMWELLVGLGVALVGGAYATFRLDGPPTVLIALLVAGVALCIAYVFKD